MSRRLVAALSISVLSACATQQAATSGGGQDDKKSGQPQVDKMTVQQVMFDVAACGPRDFVLPAAANKEALLSSFLMGRPMFNECFVAPKSRGAAPETQAKVTITVSDAEVKYDLAGTNVTPEGKACLEAALKKLPLKPQPKGAAAVTQEMPPLSFGATSPAVNLGINIASDIVGAIRVEQPAWCDCYRELGANAAPTILAALKLNPEPAADEKKKKDDKKAEALKPLELQMKAPADPAAAKLSSCLEEKIKTVALPKPATTVQVTYAFLLLNSYANGVAPDADPALQFQQLEAIRGQRVADVVLTVAHKTSAAGDYDAIIGTYRKSKDFRLLKEMKDKCAAVLAADDKWIGALTALQDTDKRILTMVQGLKAKDAASWSPVEAALDQRIAETQAELPRAAQVKKADGDACPKVK